MPGKALLGVGSQYEPTFSPPPLLSLAKAAATDAQQRQQSWSACKRRGDTAREGARRGWRRAPPAPRSRRAPPRAPALATRPSPAGSHGGRERAAGRAHASRRAHSMVRCGRGGCGRPDAAGGAHGRRAFSPPARSAALQVRRQVGAAAAHIAGLPSSGRPAPSLLPAPASRAACLPLPGGTGAPRARAGARLRAQTAGGGGDSVRACPPACPPVCASVCLCERLRLPGKAAPAGSPSAPSRAPASPPHGDWRPAAPGPVRAPGLVQGRGIPGSRSEGGGRGGGEVGEWRRGRGRAPWVRLGRRNLSAPRAELRGGRLR